jgi:hypothetical protein
MQMMTSLVVESIANLSRSAGELVRKPAKAASTSIIILFHFKSPLTLTVGVTLDLTQRSSEAVPMATRFSRARTEADLPGSGLEDWIALAAGLATQAVT